MKLLLIISLGILSLMISSCAMLDQMAQESALAAGARNSDIRNYCNSDPQCMAQIYDTDQRRADAENQSAQDMLNQSADRFSRGFDAQLRSIPRRDRVDLYLHEGY